MSFSWVRRASKFILYSNWKYVQLVRDALKMNWLGNMATCSSRLDSFKVVYSVPLFNSLISAQIWKIRAFSVPWTVHLSKTDQSSALSSDLGSASKVVVPGFKRITVGSNWLSCSKSSYVVNLEFRSNLRRCVIC